MNTEQKTAILNESSGLINHHIFDRSVVIAAHNEKEPLDHGTGMLLKLEEATVVVTAAHVINRYKPDELQIVSGQEPSNVRNAPSEKDFQGGNKIGTTDVGFLHLAEESVQKLDKKKFLSLDDFDVFPEGVAEDLAVIFGMPEDLHMLEKENIHRYDSFSYFSNIPMDFDWSSKKQRPIQVAMEYPESVEDTFTRLFAKLPEPFGMSGGGIWRARFKGATIWTPERLRVIGINAVFYRNKRLVKANRIEGLLRLLAEHFPSADAFLQQELQKLESRKSG